ncbi:MAG: spore coat associated protein CotJA [Ruminococcaceae bacterium]|nr:spore coat associated protein CotJA [Oscillospiraceae bacterium]
MDDMLQARPRVGYAFVPIQTFGEIYTPEEGLERGTIFPELDLPISVYGPIID